MSGKRNVFYICILEAEILVGVEVLFLFPSELNDDMHFSPATMKIYLPVCF